MNPIAIFALACINLDNDQIYTLYEDMLKDEVVEEILTTYPAPADDPEPVRFALNAIGTHYRIKSLIDY